MIGQIENELPVPPRQHDRHIPRDLEAIVLKALAKDPNDRFDTAEKMAKELRLFLENRPVPSRPIPLYQQFWRWCQRNPWLAGANITAAALTTILAVVSTFAWLTDRNRLRLIVAQRDEIQKASRGRDAGSIHSHSQARATRFSRRMGQRFESQKALNRAAAIGRALKLPPERFDALRDEAIACMALPDLEPTGRVITKPPGVIDGRFDSTMTRYALRFRDGTISVRRVADDQEIARFQARGDREIWVFAFSPDGRYLATTHKPGNVLTVWDIERQVVAVEDPGPVSTLAARFSPDSRLIALAHEDGELLAYDFSTGRPCLRVREVAQAHDLAFRPDGAQIAIVCNGAAPSCHVLEAATGRPIRSIALPGGGWNISWSPDGTTLVTGCSGNKTYLWHATTGVRAGVLEGATNVALGAVFHPAGSLLASNGWEGRLWLWDPVLGRPWLNLTSNAWPEFSRDGRIIVSLEDKLIPHRVDPALEYRTFAHASSQPIHYGGPSIRHDGRLLAVGTDRGVILWDLERGTELAFLPIGLAWHIRFEPSGDLLTSGSCGVQRWPVRLDSSKAEFRVGPPRPLPLPASDCGIDSVGSGRIVAQANHDFAHVLTPIVTSDPDRWMTAATFLSAPTENGWRPAIIK